MTDNSRTRIRAGASALNALDLALEGQRFEAETREFVAALLPLLDGIERVCRDIDRQPPDIIVSKAEALAILADLGDQAAGKIGLERIGRIGTIADPEECEVVDTLLIPGQPHATVVEVLQPGWRFEGKLLKPAKVIASLAPSGPAKDQGNTLGGETK